MKPIDALHTAGSALSRTGVGAAFAFLASAMVAPAHAAGPQAWRETVVYSFQGAVASDGAYPEAGLINVAGTLYGTTQQGGASGYGTVFKVTTAGTEAVVYPFGGPAANDGAFPEASLIDVGNLLYGTTYRGGAHQVGTVFSIKPTGGEKVLYSFSGAGYDGAYPAGALLNVGGILYGTCVLGGIYNAGTLFSVTRLGAETSLHSFGGNNDGAIPQGGLIDVGGTLYGTTNAGGGFGADDGTVFEWYKSFSTYQESSIWQFGAASSSDGVGPTAGLVNVNGTLYGTTNGGGTSGNGNGTVFSISAGGGGYTELYSFKGAVAGDGAFPYAGLISIGGTLYGTTEYGGAYGYGTVFKVTPAGHEAVLYSFQGEAAGDGAYPIGGLINVGGTLYGTTAQGGANGYGTVFALKP